MTRWFDKTTGLPVTVFTSEDDEDAVVTFTKDGKLDIWIKAAFEEQHERRFVHGGFKVPPYHWTVPGIGITALVLALVSGCHIHLFTTQRAHPGPTDQSQAQSVQCPTSQPAAGPTISDAELSEQIQDQLQDQLLEDYLDVP